MADQMPQEGQPTLQDVLSELRQVREELAEVREENARLKVENQGLKDRVRRLEDELISARRAAKRQAAPHRRETRVPEEQRKRPGRQPGHDPAFRRPPEEVDRVVEIPLSGCPCCGGGLEDIQEHTQYILELPEIRPVVEKHITYSGHCARCGVRQRSRSPLVASGATGAAGTIVGPYATAVASYLRSRLGATLTKISDLFGDLLSLPLSPAGVLSVLKRAAESLEPTYQDLERLIRTSPVTHADETGWRIAGENAWAWVFTAPKVTYFTIARRRGHEVALQVLGANFSGCLVTDFMAAYDKVPAATKAKCLAHLLRTLKEIEALQTAGAVRYPRAVRALFQEALALKKVMDQIEPQEFERLRSELESRLDALVSASITEPKNLRIQKRLRKHRQHLLTFLHLPDVEPTNNLAERQIRPLVLQRKISAGNRSEWGAQLHSILMSVYATCRQNGRDFLDAVREAVQGGGDVIQLLPGPP
jgi:transposase